MRIINISDNQKRDAIVNLEPKKAVSKIQYVTKDRKPTKNIRIIKTTMSTSINTLMAQVGDPAKISELLIKEDPEIDFENTGKLMSGMQRIYITQDQKIAFQIKIVDVVFAPDEQEKERKPHVRKKSNIATDFPISWSGKYFAKEEAIRKFVFNHKMQLTHVNGLTFDFLYGMAKELAEKNALMFVGAGKEGKDPLITTSDGKPYRGFLEGRVDGEKYLLILHLTEMELKEVKAE